MTLERDPKRYYRNTPNAKFRYEYSVLSFRLGSLCLLFLALFQENYFFAVYMSNDLLSTYFHLMLLTNCGSLI